MKKQHKIVKWQKIKLDYFIVVLVIYVFLVETSILVVIY